MVLCFMFYIALPCSHLILFAIHDIHRFTFQSDHHQNLSFFASALSVLLPVSFLCLLKSDLCQMKCLHQNGKQQKCTGISLFCFQGFLLFVC